MQQQSVCHENWYASIPWNSECPVECRAERTSTMLGDELNVDSELTGVQGRQS